MVHLKNPFIPNTLSHRFYDVVRNASAPATAKVFFNKVGAGYRNAHLANGILENTSYLLKNITRPGKPIKLSHKIVIRHPRQVDKVIYDAQVKNTRQFLESYAELRGALNG